MAAGIHLLVDLENVQPSPQDVEAWLGDVGQAWVFYGPHQLKRKAGFEMNSPRSTLVPISRPGSNSLDFHLVFYLGYLAAKHPECRFVVLAKDTGYDPPIAHAKTLAFSVKRMHSLSETVTTRGASAKTAIAQPSKKDLTASATKKKASSSIALKSEPTKAGSSTRQNITPPTHVKEKRAQKLPIEVYRDLVKDLKGPNRPNSLPALQRHIQTKFGLGPVPEKVQMLVDRLLTSGVIHLADSKLRYWPAQLGV